jgi:hypothetical protein
MTHANSFWTDKKIAHPGVKTSVGRGKPAMIPAKQVHLNVFSGLITIFMLDTVICTEMALLLQRYCIKIQAVFPNSVTFARPRFLHSRCFHA